MAGLTTGAIVGIATGVVGLVGSLFGAGAKKREAYLARLERDTLKGELTELENSRQDIINPYDQVKDLSSMAKDLSGMVSNPFANLGVATQAADIQIEQTDIALANTLDVLRATGSGAGGATALAQAALASKKGVAAGIEGQEAANEKMKAQGQQQLERLQMAEAQRVQGIGMSEAQRMQNANISGRTFEFNAKDKRESEKLNRKQAQITGAAQQAVAASQGAAQIYSAGLTATMGIGAALAGNPSGLTKKPPSTPPKFQQSCFMIDSKVLMKNNTSKNIQDVKIGDKVKTTNGFALVIETLKHDINDVFKIYTNDLLRTTATHPLYVNEEWTTAEELGWNNELMFVDKLYNLKTDNVFIVDNVVVSGIIATKQLEKQI